MPDGHEAIARIRDLRAHEILDVLSPALFKDWEEITILEREDLDALIQTNTRISEATRAALHDLAAMLDNQLIWCTIREASVIIVGLNKEYYLQSLQVDASTTGLLLCNSRGTVIASNIQLANEKERQDFEENASQYRQTSRHCQKQRRGHHCGNWHGHESVSKCEAPLRRIRGSPHVEGKTAPLLRLPILCS